jgi:antitoxin component YwqK of YwqJK toxin-antitoxin module
VTIGYSQEYVLVKRATYKADGSGELTDGEHIFRSKTDPNSVVFAYYKDGLLHGKWASHKNIPNGSAPSEERNYKNGKLHGVRTIYDASRVQGTPSVGIQEMMYKDGKLHGTSYIYQPVYAEDGSCFSQIVAEVNYRNGIPTGVQRAYINGRLSEETTLAADGSCILDGVCTYYANDGAIYQRATFKMGVLDGFLRFYDARSVERVRILMKNGRPKEGSKAMYYDASGVVEEECKVEFGAFLADFLEEGAIVRQNATFTTNGFGFPVHVQLREPEPESESELEEDSCYCGMCCGSSRYDDYDSDDDYDRYRDRYRYRQD